MKTQRLKPDDLYLNSPNVANLTGYPRLLAIALLAVDDHAAQITGGSDDESLADMLAVDIGTLQKAKQELLSQKIIGDEWIVQDGLFDWELDSDEVFSFELNPQIQIEFTDEVPNPLNNPKVTALSFSDRWHYVALNLLLDRGFFHSFQGNCEELNNQVATRLEIGANYSASLKLRLLEQGLIDANWMPEQ